MAQNSGFFDALQVNGEYDRTYSAADYCDNLATIIKNGVRYSAADDLKVTAAGGMALSVAIGRAWINGHYFYNDTEYTALTIGTAPTGSNKRIDRVVLRLNTAVAQRNIELAILQGTAAASPSAPELTRSGDVYEIAIADVLVNAGATDISDANITDQRANGTVCGWASSVTPAIMSLLKQYIWATTLEESTSTVTFDIPQFDAADVHILEVYTNGILETLGTDYTRSGNTLSFALPRTVGAEIKVILYKSIDGTGLSDVSDEITALQNAVAALQLDGDAVFVCNGATDNIRLSQLAQNWLTGGTDYACRKIRVIGTFGVSSAYGGAGTSANPYRWISVGTEAATNRRIIFDFSACSQLSFPISAGTYNTVFFGYNAHIIGANVVVSNTETGTSIKIFSSSAGAVYAENCRFWITSYQDSRIANTGTFVNCRGSVANIINNSYCFLPYSESLLRLQGGEYYAYTGAAESVSAIVGQSAANAVSILYGVNAPTVARSGFYQTHSIVQYVGGGIMNCTDLVSELAVTVTAGISNIRGTIPKSKSGLM